MLYQKIPRGLRTLAWKFWKEKKDLPTFDVWAVSIKQTWPPSLSSLGVDWNEYRGFIRRSIKCYSTKHPHKYLEERLRTKKHPVFISPQSCTHGILDASLPNCSSFNFRFKWTSKLWMNGENALQADFRCRLLMWTVLKDHFARPWPRFYRRWIRFAIFEDSVNSLIWRPGFAHALRLHVFHAWIERSI